MIGVVFCLLFDQLLNYVVMILENLLVVGNFVLTLLMMRMLLLMMLLLLMMAVLGVLDWGMLLIGDLDDSREGDSVAEDFDVVLWGRIF